MIHRSVDVALVRMPYSELGQPSLALGLLRACCDREGVSARVVPANLWLGEELGPAIHNLIYEAYSTTLVGEWTFANCLFPEFNPDDEHYLRKVSSIFKLDHTSELQYVNRRFPHLDFVALMREIRHRAPEFIEAAVDRVLALNPRIVGCTSTFQQHCASLAFLRRIKERRPDVITMIGGANCEAEMGKATFEHFPFLDFVVSGEADGFFGSWCKEILASGIESQTELRRGVWGPIHRTHSELAGTDEVDGAPIARLDNMDDSPIPNYDDYFRELEETCLGNYIHPALPFQTARGCWWGKKNHCTFCGISRTAMEFRSKSGDNVIDQMVTLRDRYGIDTFQGTEYIFDYKYFKTLLPRLKSLNSHFRFEVKANLKVEQIKAFVDCGVVEVQPGVESLSDGILALLKKGVTTLQNILLLKRGRNEGLSIYWNLLHSIPNDRDEWYREMAELVPHLTHLQPPVGFAQIHYDRFSPYWREPEKHGLDLNPAFGYEYVYPFPDKALRDFAYFFETESQRSAFLQFSPVENEGLVRLTDALKSWKDAFRSEERPALCAEIGEDRTRFTDTRSLAVSPEFEVTGLEHEIYPMAEDGIYMADIQRACCEGGAHEPSEVFDAVQRLMDLKVWIMASGRYVNLGLRTPLRPLACELVDKPAAVMNPTKAKLQADVALERMRPSIALSCLRLPYEQQQLTNWLAAVAPMAPEA